MSGHIEWHTRGQQALNGTGRSGNPHISVSAQGLICVNRVAMERLGAPPRIRIGYNRDAHTLILAPAASEDLRAVKASPVEGGSAMASGVGALRSFGVFDATPHGVDGEAHDGMLVFPLWERRAS